MTSTILDEYGMPWKYAHASDRNTRRGGQYPVRQDDIFRLINSTDRATLASLSSRLFTNFGVLKGAISQKADFVVGESWLPSYAGESDFEDGKTITKFLAEVWLPQCDVRGGMHDWWRMLETTSIAMDRDGDAFWMFVIGSDKFPRIQQIPQHRIRGEGKDGRVESDGKTKFSGYRIRDGIIYNASGRPAAYHIDFGENGTENFKDIPASDLIHFFDPNFSEQGRGLPLFTHALEDFKTCLASTSDERRRQELISRLHLTIFNETGGPDLDDPTIASNAITSDGFSTQSIPGGIMYQPFGAAKIEQVTHDNPGEIWEAFQDRLIRNALAGAGWPYSLWKPAGQGTAERADVLKARRSVTRRQKQLTYGARRALGWAYAVFQQQGRVPLLDYPFAWKFSRPPRLSVDDGRESKMELDELVTGSRNLSEILAARGLTEDDFYLDRAWSVASRKYYARSVSEEASKKWGMEIEVEDREMMMLNPNEPAPVDESDMEPKTKPKTDDEDSND